MLSTPWEQRKNSYDFVVIGSGYGGRHYRGAPRVRQLNPKPSHLHSGTRQGMAAWRRSPRRSPDVLSQTPQRCQPAGPLRAAGNYHDISVIKGSGLGGTSLINANVAIVPDREVFELVNWPAAITLR